MKREDRNKPTRWRYRKEDGGEPVPLWHALDTLSCHWRFGYYDGLRGNRPGSNGNPDYERAQLAGFRTGLEERQALEERAAKWAEENYLQSLLTDV